MQSAYENVYDCGVIDIDATGSLFTWNNKQKPEERIYSRIDRFLVNKDWCDHFPDLYAHFLPEGLMDHTPCIISSSKNLQRKRCFKYFNMWGEANEFLHTIRSNWDKGLMGTSMFRLVKNLKHLKPALKSLNKEGYNDIEYSTSRLQKQVHDLQEQLGRNPTDTQLLIAEFEASRELKKLSSARDSFLAQKAKHFWMKEGDTNSAYFHGILKKRRNGNRVIFIEDMNGKMCDSPELVQTAFLEYYMQLLGTKQANTKIHRKIIDQGQRCRDEHKPFLLRPVTGEEIRAAQYSYSITNHQD
ncbi:uncharacterized protein LOC141655715 [Silene latifolia]|uniref:uncharacterized protein LOC141655715 n=1 Tax=Silene latifolia TaxID=37657 RepID=UPI003D771F7F